MAFPWTLQRYVFRELGKTFALTSVALTITLSLGGGVLNMLELGEVTPGQLLRLMAFMVPVAIALTLPIAALFSAAATYGRFSADNEFLACRSSGINLHVLFLPTVLMSIGSAGVTFGLSNFMIPDLVRGLNEFVSADFGALIQQRLNRPRGITLGGRYRIHADEAVVDPENPDRVTLDRVAFIEVDGEDWIRFGTAGQVDLRFDRGDDRIRVAGSLINMSYYDRPKGQFLDLGTQRIPPNDLPPLLSPEIKFLTLGELWRIRSAPETWRDVQMAVERLRSAMGRRAVYDALEREWLKDKTITLTGEDLRYAIRAGQALRLPRDGGIELHDVVIEARERTMTRTARTPRAVLDIERGDTLADSGLRIELYEARITQEGRTINVTRETMGPVALPRAWIEPVEQMPAEAMLAVATEDPRQDPVGRMQAELTYARGEVVRRIVATISERTAFSVSVFVLVLLGATLGIIFRGSHAVVAFGISFIPSVVVMITIVTGKQMAQNEGTHLVGLLIMWSGIALVAVLDFWTMTRVLRR